MADKTQYDLVVIGSGPAGYTGAIRAAQLGMRVACVEREPALGGTCLRIGCIPSKALLESSARLMEAKAHFAEHGIRADNLGVDFTAMQKRKDGIVKTLTQGIAGLFRKNKITRLSGHASIVAAKDGGWAIDVKSTDGTEQILGKKVLLATGSKEAVLRGIEMHGDRIGSSTEALGYSEVPKHLVVIGAGAIGLEMGSVYSRLGAKVTVLEYAPRILPAMDAELATATQKILATQGLIFRFATKVTKAAWNGTNCVVEIESADPIECDRVLVATGRVPNTDGLGLEHVGITLDKRGRVPIDAQFKTSAENIYAVGDIVVGPMLAHKAEEEAVACVEMLAGKHGHINYDSISYIVYTDPEVAAVGKTEEELKEAKTPYKKGSFPFMANGRARAMGDTSGWVKILAHAETDRILGAHIVGPRAGDLIVELATAINFGASSEDVARTCHPHPTLSEVIREAALAVDNRMLNL
jgi:dihydrolipoamide dehydrogenase